MTEDIHLVRNEEWSRISGAECFSTTIRDKSVTLLITVPSDDLGVCWSVSGGGMRHVGTTKTRGEAEAEICKIVNGGVSDVLDNRGSHVARPAIRAPRKTRRK
jgi:hypothetical protein